MKTCSYCKKDCKRGMPDWAPSFVVKSFPRNSRLHTCQQGQGADKRVYGYCWKDVWAMRPNATLADIAITVVGLPMLEFLAQQPPPALAQVTRAIKSDYYAAESTGDCNYMLLWLKLLSVVTSWLESGEPEFEPA